MGKIESLKNEPDEGAGGPGCSPTTLTSSNGNLASPLSTSINGASDHSSSSKDEFDLNSSNTGNKVVANTNKTTNGRRRASLTTVTIEHPTPPLPSSSSLAVANRNLHHSSCHSNGPTNGRLNDHHHHQHHVQIKIEPASTDDSSSSNRSNETQALLCKPTTQVCTNQMDELTVIIENNSDFTVEEDDCYEEEEEEMTDDEDDEGYEFEESDDTPVIPVDNGGPTSRPSPMSARKSSLFSALKSSNQSSSSSFSTATNNSHKLSMLHRRRIAFKNLFRHFPSFSSTSSGTSVECGDGRRQTESFKLPLSNGIVSTMANSSVKTSGCRASSNHRRSSSFQSTSRTSTSPGSSSANGEIMMISVDVEASPSECGSRSNGAMAPAVVDSKQYEETHL